jgi:EAL domain-containing protein (putative c-di-GMP-specific phosphodiesterase class I)
MEASTEIAAETSTLGIERHTLPPVSEDARAKAGPPRVLVADDEHELLRGYVRLLGRGGFVVDAASDGATALELIGQHDYDVVLSDISMPGLDGISLLKNIRKNHPDLPVILITAEPTVATAVTALEYGALRYLIKPVDGPALEAAVRSAIQLHAIGRIKRKIVEHIGRPEMGLSDRSSLEISFERALSGLWMAYQPIFRASDHSLFAYEALLRSREPTLPNPEAVLGAAERLGRLSDLGGIIRGKVGAALVRMPGVCAFVNLHTKDLADSALYVRELQFSELAPRIVLEITERAPLDVVKDVPGRVAELRGMGFRIAIDDLGAGYAGLSSFAQLVPEVVKLDMSLVRGIHADPIRQKLVRSMASLCHEMGMLVVAEGVETRRELDSVVALGCDLLQGFYFGKPQPETSVAA